MRLASWTVQQAALVLVLVLAVAAVGSGAGQQRLPGGDAGQQEQSPFDDEFEALVTETLAAWHVPGVAVAVLDGDATWTEVRAEQRGERRRGSECGITGQND